MRSKIDWRITSRVYCNTVDTDTVLVLEYLLNLEINLVL